MLMPKGKGMCIWILSRLIVAYGSIEGVVERLVEMKVSWIIIKVSNGRGKYNLRPVYLPGTRIRIAWADDILKPFVDACKIWGIKVHGYQYTYADNPVLEAKAGAERCWELELDGFVINAEKEYKDNPGAASPYTETLLLNLPDNIPIGMSSYRFPSLHPRFPFKQFMVDDIYWLPQVYWMGRDNPGEQLEQSNDELMSISDTAVVPIGFAFSEMGYGPPPLREMDEFHDKVLELNLIAETWWRFDTARQWSLLEAITAHQWPDGSAPIPPIPPPTNCEPVLDDMQAVIDNHRN